MNIQQLRYLVGVIDSGSMSAAARALNVTQPVISRSIRDFEREHGMKVFALSGRRLIATEAGTSVIASARRALAAIDEVAETARKPRQETELPVATTPTTGALLALALGQLGSDDPELRVRLRRANDTAEAAEMVLQGNAELAFGVMSQFAQWQELTVIPLGEIEVVLASPIATELPDPVSWGDLGELPLITPLPTSDLQRDIEERVRLSAGRTQRSSLVSDDRTCWITAAQAGIGSFITYGPVIEGVPGIEIRRFREAESVTVGFAHRGFAISPFAARLIHLVRSSRIFSSGSQGSQSVGDELDTPIPAMP
jgi:LysR family transcriptional regulator, cyn operon transcriptional activator